MSYTATVELEFHPLANIFPLMEGQEFEALVEDIKAANGLHEKITLYEGCILDGRNRYRACKALGIDITTLEFDEYDGPDPLGFVISLNLARRHLSESQRAMIAAQCANMRQGARTDLAQICAMSQSDSAKRFNISRRSVQLAKQVVDRGIPELIENVERGDLPVSKAAEISKLSPEQQEEILANAQLITAERAKNNRAKRDEIAEAKIAALPEDVFPTVAADFPWPVDGPTLVARPDGGAVDYPTMKLDEIRGWALTNILKVAASDCNLFLWTTQRFLRFTIELLDVLDFRHSGTFVWEKVTEAGASVGIQNPGFPQNNCEFVVHGRSGSADFVDTKGLRYSFRGLRREHSRKPDEFYEMIRKATRGPRVDLFARDTREGWVAWGNESEKFDEANMKAKEKLEEIKEVIAFIDSMVVE